MSFVTNYDRVQKTPKGVRGLRHTVTSLCFVLNVTKFMLDHILMAFADRQSTPVEIIGHTLPIICANTVSKWWCERQVKNNFSTHSEHIRFLISLFAWPAVTVPNGKG